MDKPGAASRAGTRSGTGGRRRERRLPDPKDPLFNRDPEDIPESRRKPSFVRNVRRGARVTRHLTSHPRAPLRTPPKKHPFAPYSPAPADRSTGRAPARTNFFVDVLQVAVKLY